MVIKFKVLSEKAYETFYKKFDVDSNDNQWICTVDYLYFYFMNSHISANAEFIKSIEQMGFQVINIV